MAKRLFFIFFTTVILTACSPVERLYRKPPSINLFYDRVVIDYALQNPELLSYAGLVEDFGIYYHNALLTDASDEFSEKLLMNFYDDLDVLKSYKKSKQSPSQQLSTEILEWYLTNRVNNYPYILYKYPINQLEGVQNELPNFMVTIHSISEKRDVKHYIKRLKKFPAKFDQVLDGLESREKLNIIPPDYILEKVIRDMEQFISKPSHENILYLNLAEKIQEVEIDSVQKKELLLEAAQVINTHVYPAYQKLINYSRENLLPKAESTAGVWRFPNGDDYYAYKLKTHTTTSLSPAEVHAIGIKEVGRITAEMREIFNQLGYDPGISIGEHLKSLSTDPKFLYSNNDAGRTAILTDFKAIINKSEEHFYPYLELDTSQKVVVERVPKFKEATASGAYYEAPSFDGTRAGTFFVNLRDISQIPKFGMRTLAYHEAIPGHHTQIISQLSLTDLPIFRRIIPFTAYVEGWALYAEKLAWETGAISDPYDNLGRLQAELFRAVRLVVDTGIHYKRWSREQAIDYMQEQTGMNKKDVISEVERYIVDPGQATAYKIGELKILELRKNSKEKLGEKFDLKEFHSVILGNGGMPLEILEKVVDKYIQDKLNAGTLVEKKK